MDGIITIDEKGSVQSFNPASERIFGYSQDEVLGKNVKFLMPEPYHSEHDHYLQNYLTTGTAKIIGMGREVIGLRKDKSEFPLELAISEVYMGEDRFFTGIVRDISERKNFENALKESKTKADNANLAKSIFLANMSHEIRTPMNAVLGYSQILMREKNLDKEILEAIKIIDRSGQSLLDLINEILDISKIEAGKMELNPVNYDLELFIKEIDSLFALRCKQNNLMWEVNNLSSSTIVFSDENKLRQILINLLGNAVKFTDAGKITLSVTELSNSNFKFEVQDTGIGIPLDKQESVFEPFQQEEGGQKKGGTGLGLAICKKQLELLDSDLKLKSEVNKGTRFSFIIKMPPGDTNFIQDNSSKRIIKKIAPRFKVKALVVDDVDINRDVLKKLLTLIGVEVIEAENGRTAVEKVREHHPDIIFMDMRMPVMNGEEATRIIQNEFGMDKFKIVVITASALERRRDYYIDLGFHEFIGKPFRDNQIFDCLKELLHIEFIYDDQQQEKEDLDFTGVSLKADFVIKFKNAAELYSVTELEWYLKEMAQMGEETKPLQEHLKNLLKSYDMEGILKVLNNISTN